MINNVKAWLEDGIVDVFLGYREMDHHHLPHCFTREHMEEVDDLVISQVRYPLEKIATHMTEMDPDIKIGMLARDCNDRALNVLFLWNQLKAENVSTLTVNCCPSRLKEHGDCSYLTPEKAGVFKKQVGVDNNLEVEELDTYGRKERLNRWMYEFQKCIKCYGCRNICPVCFCKECSLEHDELIKTGPLLPEIPVFHMVRAVHMAGRCIDCGLCEAACPMDIPLRLLYGKVSQIVKDVFNYDTGSSALESPFNILGDKVALEPKPMEPAIAVNE